MVDLMNSIFRTFTLQNNGIPIRVVPSENRWRRVLIGAVDGIIFLTASATQIGTNPFIPSTTDGITANPGDSFVVGPTQDLYAIIPLNAISLTGFTLSVHVSDHVSWERLKHPEVAVPA